MSDIYEPMVLAPVAEINRLRAIEQRAKTSLQRHEERSNPYNRAVISELLGVLNGEGKPE